MNEDPKPKRGRPQKFDADKTLETAMRAYWAADPADVSINSICTLAGVSKPALYRVFGGEDGLMRAVLDGYADRVLVDIFDILSRDASMTDTLDALAYYASEDAKMATGCVFYKMRAGKHRLGPKTRERVEELDAGAVAAFTAYLEARQAVGDLGGTAAPPTVARFLIEQIGLALMQRAAGEDPDQVKDTLNMAFSALRDR